MLVYTNTHYISKQINHVRRIIRILIRNTALRGISGGQSAMGGGTLAENKDVLRLHPKAAERINNLERNGYDRLTR